MFEAKDQMPRRPTLQTRRLILRPFQLSDAREVQRLAGDRAIGDTTLTVPHPYESGMAEQWISKHQDAFNQQKEVNFAITGTGNGELVGLAKATHQEMGSV